MGFEERIGELCGSDEEWIDILERFSADFPEHRHIAAKVLEREALGRRRGSALARMALMRLRIVEMLETFV